jgi:hypothetical protein
MSFLRQPSSHHFLVPTRSFLRTQRAAFTSTSHCLAISDYGSGDGDPRGENPQSQGINASADIEHPGPPPPAEGIGSGAGPTKGGDKHSHASALPSTGSVEPEGISGASRSTQDLHPAILDEKPLEKGEWSKGVQEHNQEVRS